MQRATGATKPEGEAAAVDPRRWLTLSVIIMAMFMVVLDIFIVNVALPTIQQDLGADFTRLQWIVAAYVLGYAVLMITGGRLGDLLGRKRMFLAGVAGFALTSAWCGFAGNAEMLIAARVFQGVAAAAMVPQVLSMIQVLFPVEERGKAFGIYGAVLGLGGIAGQIVGGLLLRADWWDLGWRLIFLVNVPVGLVAFVLAVRLVRESYAPERKRLDLPGVGMVSLGLLLLVYPLTVGRERGWPAWVYVSIALSAVVLAGFVAYERRVMARGASPLVPMTLFRDAAFRKGMGIALAFFSGNAALYFIFSVFMQSGVGDTPMESAYTFAPMGIGFLLASLSAPPLTKRYGTRVLMGGTALMAVGYALIIAILSYREAPTGAMLALPLLVAGAGQGAVASPLFHTVLAGVRSAHAGAASGVLNTFMQVAQALGVAVLGSLFQSLLGHYSAHGHAAGYRDAMQAALGWIIALAALSFVLIASLGASRRAGNREVRATSEAS